MYVCNDWSVASRLGFVPVMIRKVLMCSEEAFRCDLQCFEMLLVGFYNDLKCFEMSGSVFEVF